jgi:cellulose synthase operon protein YhjQ
MTNDISNLLRRFGANANGYLEVEHEIEYKELPKTPVAASVAPANSQAGVNDVADAPIVAEKKNAAVPLSVAAVNPLPPREERVEPTIGDLPEVSSAKGAMPPATASVHAMPSSLRSLLSEVALEREAQARARNEEASHHTSINAVQTRTPAQVIAIVSPKGGVGKTTICAALAGVLNRKGRVIAIDLDPQNALQYHLGVGTHAASPAEAGLAGRNWRSLLQDGAAGACVLPYGTIPEEERRALEHRLRQDSHWLAGQLARMNLHAEDVVILDTPGGRTPYLEQALAVADQVAVVLTPDAGSFMALEHIAPLFEQRSDCGFIVNQFDGSRTFCQDMLEVLKRRLGSKLIGVVSLDHAIGETLAYGVNTVLENQQLPLWGEIQAIADALQPNVKASALAGSRAS